VFYQVLIDERFRIHQLVISRLKTLSEAIAYRASTCTDAFFHLRWWTVSRKVSGAYFGARCPLSSIQGLKTLFVEASNLCVK
jgi:hypothetical protein